MRVNGIATPSAGTASHKGNSMPTSQNPHTEVHSISPSVPASPYPPQGRRRGDTETRRHGETTSHPPHPRVLLFVVPRVSASPNPPIPASCRSPVPNRFTIIFVQQETRGLKMATIRHFRELRVYQKAMKLTMRIFELTKRFPREEMYSLTDQIRRSSRSVCANLGEAWRKRRYEKAFVSKLSDAETEAAESQVHLEIAHKSSYISDATFRELDREYEAVLGMLVTMADRSEEWVIREEEGEYECDAGIEGHGGEGGRGERATRGHGDGGRGETAARQEDKTTGRQ